MISQSGETADTLAAMREAKRRGARTLGIVNVVGSTIARERRRRHLPPRRPGDRRRVDQGVHEPGDRAAALHAQAGAAARPVGASTGREIIEAHAALPAQIQQILDRAQRDRGDRRGVQARDELPVPGPRLQLPGRARGRAQAEGDQLHPRRGISGGRDEARPDRADRRDDAGGVRRAARLGVRQGRVERAGGEGARRAGSSRSRAATSRRSRARSTTSSAFRRRSTC